MAAALVGLNLVSYTQRPAVRESELNPNRSSYNNSPTGTLALFRLLNATGREAVRWEKPVDELLLPSNDNVRTFVIIGPTLDDITLNDATRLYEWVADGGHLVVVGRDLPSQLDAIGEGWTIRAVQWRGNWEGTMNPTGDMTGETAVPVLPAAVMNGVSSVQTSVLTADLNTYFLGDTKTTDRGPISLLTTRKSNATVMVQSGFGKGSLTFLADPYIVSNRGIAKSDNLRLAVNMLHRGDGVIAFDEYHHGHRYEGNDLVAYFSRTPVIAVVLQGCLIAGLFFLARSVRFGRALPEQKMPRTSKLEYVSAMAELQRRTRAYDVAVENAYDAFKRKCCRFFGFDISDVSSAVLAASIAERIGADRDEIVTLLSRCEDIVRGDGVGGREALKLVRRIREFERELRF